MNTIFKSGIAALAAFATLAATVPAQADHWRRGGDRHYGHGQHGYERHYERRGPRHYDRRGPRKVYVRKGHDDGDLIAAGVIGLATGAIVGGLLSQSRPVYRQPTYVAPARPAPAPVYSGYSRPAEAWTAEWYRDCQARYRSFDARSGTFMGYDGQRHFCQPR